MTTINSSNPIPIDKMNYTLYIIHSFKNEIQRNAKNAKTFFISNILVSLNSEYYYYTKACPLLPFSTMVYPQPLKREGQEFGSWSGSVDLKLGLKERDESITSVLATWKPWENLHKHCFTGQFFYTH